MAAMLTQFEDLAADNTSGATELIQRILALCESGAMGNTYNEIREGLNLLEDAHSSMPSLHTVIQILKSEFLPGLKNADDLEQSLRYIVSLQKILEESGAQIAEKFLSVLERPTRILTISRSSTVISALKKAHKANKLSHLYVLEARPAYEGWRTVRDCSAAGISSTLMVDAAMGEAVQTAEAVVIGADSVSSDGYLLNKTGTLPLAICASEFGLPLYVLCDSLKFSPQTRRDVTIDEHPDSEVIEKEESDAFKVWNRYFEWVPINYVEAFITERGVFPPEELEALSTEETAADE
ncbi:MAG: hypothetical protein CL946_07480 [Ectothiorhodospiraceae bacterium]|nr:hypothetical protein [Ectothiorhodospiraceae bacterium]